MQHRTGNGHISIKWKNFPSAECAFANVLVIKKADDRWCIKVFQSGQIFLTAKEIPAKSYLTGFIPRRQKPVVSDSDKTLRGNVHQKPAYEFFTGDGNFIPLALIFIILRCKGYRAVCHSFDPVVADRDPMGIFSQIPDHGFSAIKRFLAVRHPFFSVAEIQKFFESVMIFKTL